MVEVSFDSNESNLHIKIGGDNFYDLVQFVKMQGCHWNKDLKCWTLSITKFDDFKKACSTFGEQLDVDFLTLNEIDSWKKSLNELKVYRRAFHQELLKCPPLKGKKPYESYQLNDILRGLCQNRFLYHHEMGLGKSYILAALIEHKRYYKDCYKCLIFSTPIGTRNLKSELLKFSANLKDSDIITFTSANSVKFEDRDVFNIKKYPQSIIIMSYDFLKSVANYYYDAKYATVKTKHPSSGKKYKANPMPIKEWLEGQPGGLFLDENHSLAAPSSRRTQIMNMIVPYFDQRFEFTGTLADKYEKLYEPCWILDKSLVEGMDYNTWLSTYNELGNRFSAYAINPNKWNMKKLDELDFIMQEKYCAKRKMVDCLDLPLNYEVPIVYVDMSPLHRSIYERFSNFTASEIAKIATKGKSTFSDRMISLFQYIQIAVDNPTGLFSTDNFQFFPKDLQDDIKKFNWNKDFAKAEVYDEIIDERTNENGEKGILWYFHPQTKDALIERYKKYDPTVVSADVPMDERTDLINKFLKDSSKKLLIASINVMNTSVTLTECKYEIYVEKTYNYTTYIQSRGRIFRPGQTEITRTYTIRFNDSIDNVQELNLTNKGMVLDSLFNAGRISADVWKKIFSMKNIDDGSFMKSL